MFRMNIGVLKVIVLLSDNSKRVIDKCLKKRILLLFFIVIFVVVLISDTNADKRTHITCIANSCPSIFS